MIEIIGTFRFFAEKDIRMKRHFLLSALLFCLVLPAAAQESYIYVNRDSIGLEMDFYRPVDQANDYCVLYVFGGGFSSGSIRSKSNVSYFKELAQAGYSVAAIDYRLGMKDMRYTHVWRMVPNFENAIRMAVEDCSAALAFLVDKADSLHIQSDKIIACGSSAGAITVLQCDYCRANHSAWTSELPEGFRFAGVVSYSGGIFSREGKVDYQDSPAPTFFAHGTNDKIVRYDKIQFLNLGMFGTKSLASRFRKFGYSYFAVHYDGLGHDVAGFGSRTLSEFQWFTEQYVNNGRPLNIDSHRTEEGYTMPDWALKKTKDIY